MEDPCFELRQTYISHIYREITDLQQQGADASQPLYEALNAALAEKEQYDEAVRQAWAGKVPYDDAVTQAWNGLQAYDDALGEAWNGLTPYSEAVSQEISASVYNGPAQAAYNQYYAQNITPAQNAYNQYYAQNVVPAQNAADEYYRQVVAPANAAADEYYATHVAPIYEAINQHQAEVNNLLQPYFDQVQRAQTMPCNEIAGMVAEAGVPLTPPTLDPQTLAAMAAMAGPPQYSVPVPGPEEPSGFQPEDPGFESPQEGPFSDDPFKPPVDIPYGGPEGGDRPFWDAPELPPLPDQFEEEKPDPDYQGPIIEPTGEPSDADYNEIDDTPLEDDEDTEPLPHEYDPEDRGPEHDDIDYTKTKLPSTEEIIKEDTEWRRKHAKNATPAEMARHDEEYRRKLYQRRKQDIIEAGGRKYYGKDSYEEILPDGTIHTVDRTKFGKDSSRQWESWDRPDGTHSSKWNSEETQTTVEDDTTSISKQSSSGSVDFDGSAHHVKSEDRSETTEVTKRRRKVD